MHSALLCDSLLGIFACRPDLAVNIAGEKSTFLAASVPEFLDPPISDRAEEVLGTPVMKEMLTKIRFIPIPIPRGSERVISSGDEKAIKATNFSCSTAASVRGLPVWRNLPAILR
jgi:hypothetical protein